MSLLAFSFDLSVCTNHFVIIFMINKYSISIPFVFHTVFYHGTVPLVPSIFLASIASNFNKSGVQQHTVRHCSLFCKERTHNF